MKSFTTSFLPVLYLTCFLVSAELLFSTDQAWSQPVRISVSDDSLRAGQLFDVYIVFEGSREFDSIIFPDSSAFSDPFEYRSSAIGLNAQQHDSLRTTLQFFGSSTDTLSGMFALGIREADTLLFDLPDITLFFKSKLAEEEELRPLKPIFSFGISLLPWIIGILLLTVLLGAAWYIKKKYFPPKPEPKPQPAFEPPPPFINPIDSLSDEITALRGMLKNGDPDDDVFYVRLGDAIRAYFERVYDFPALEQTTREVTQALKSRKLEEQLLQRTVKLLQDCDMVKFAKTGRNRMQMEEDLSRLEELASLFRTNDSRLLMQLRLEHERKYKPQTEAGGKTT
ncbi:MAG: hypothetical protein LAT84_01185 [Balneolia bacterium]|nr:hypothetical protein [Balneolia bacterium]